MFNQDDTRWGYRLVVVCTVIVCMTLLWLGDGNPAIALAPLGAAAVAWLVWNLPMRLLAHGLLFIGLLVDNPTERPGRNLYRSVLYYPGTLMYEPLSKTLSIPGFKFTGMELLLAVLGVIIGLRVLVRDPVDGEGRVQAAAPLLKACVVAFLTLAGLEAYGMLRGGSLAHSLLQMRTMLLMPLLTLFFAYAFKKRRDVHGVLGTFLVVAVLRAILCIYYYLTFMRVQPKSGESGDGSYVTTHSDSILAAVAITICIVSIYQHPSLRTYVIAALVVPLIGLGIIFNNRRIAFVAVAMGCFFSYLAANPWFRRRVHRTLLTVLPFLLLYTAVGWKAQSGWAKPVQSLKSVIVQRDTSSATRDVENFNLLQTFKANPLIGSGFGHEYKELVRAWDISKIFEAYRYVPHNSILWFWGVGGVAGFTLYWMFLVVGTFMAARVCRFAQSNRQAVMAMTALTAVTAYGSQCFGDMGLMSWMGSLIVSASLGLCASLATRIGAWNNINTSAVAMLPPQATPSLALPTVVYHAPPPPAPQGAPGLLA